MPPAEALPICDLGALGARRTRHQRVLRRLLAAATAVDDTADALVVALPSDPALFRTAATWISLERRCCAFVDFSLEWSRDGGIRLALRADEAGRGALRAGLAAVGGEE